MRRTLIALMLTAMAFLLACGNASVGVASGFTVRLTNQSEDPFHGFGVEWFENGEMVDTGMAMKKDFLFVKTGESLNCEMPVHGENIDKSKEYSVRVYIIGTDHATYCMDDPMVVDPGSDALELTIGGSETEGWTVQ